MKFYQTLCGTVLSGAVYASLLTAPAHSQQTSPEAINQEIVVIGKKLSEVKFDFKATKKGQVKKCVVTKRSGDVDLDILPCKVVATCAAKGFKKQEQLLTCMSSEWKASVRTLAERRLLSKG